jgi:hypothetical protein
MPFPHAQTTLVLYVPVYDYVLMTEPLTPAQRESIGWHGREGISDASRQFHYTRTTADGRILWGGYDAVYHWNNGFGRILKNRTKMFRTTGGTLLPGISPTRRAAFHARLGRSHRHLLALQSILGHDASRKDRLRLGIYGLGVGASRLGRVSCSIFSITKRPNGPRLRWCAPNPLPFPPEPLRSIGINLTRWSMDQADRNQGRENLWLRVMDWLGLGFDS